YDYTVRIGDEPFRVSGAVVSPEVLAILRATPAIGRFFAAGEDLEGAAPVAILSDRLWRERYGSDPAIAGKTIVIDGRTHTIVGVARSQLRFPNPNVLFWIPYRMPTDDVRSAQTIVFTALGRLRPGVTTAQAEAEGTAIARSVPRPPSAEFFFGKGGPVVVHARTFVADMTRPVRPALLVLAAAVGLVLLIACANVANLLLSRGVTRHRELAIRAAIGASRGRLVRQLVTESVVLSAVGGAIGLALAWTLVRLLPLAAPARLPRLDDVGIDRTVVLFGVSASLFAALASGLAPARRSSRFDLYQAFRGGDGSPGGSGPAARGLRRGLLMGEAAFAVVLTVGASLLAHSFLRLTRVDGGYDTEHVMTLSVEVPDGPMLPERTARFIDGMLARIRATPGISTAGAANMMPMMIGTAVTGITLPPGVGAGKPATGRALSYVVTPGYAEALGLRLKEGRFFTEADARDGGRGVLVNEEFVRRFVASAPVVGLRLGRLYEGEGGADTEIIGTVGNVLKDGNDRAPEPEIYFVHGSHAERIVGYVNLVLRSSDEASTVSRALRRYVREVDAGAAVDRAVPLGTLVASSWDQPRFATSVVSGFAVLAMGLAGLGLYGALSYSVSQRRRELGLRAALGATRRNLVALVLRDGLSITLMGLVVGVVAASLVTRLLRGLLFGVTPLDAAAFVMGPSLLLCVTVIACALPALRAASADPAVALRDE
ncbi:MAG TPA: ADOP family duplicated permease, partial [Vicinamibacterales bacterium]|nr:ADOP family duplicated permease [Vicinamibacterales bacterium]